MANTSLVVRVSAQIAEFQKSFNDMSKTAKGFASDFEGMATRAAAVGTFIGNIATDMAKSLASGFVGAIKDAVKFSTEFQNAFLGLNSVARAFGTSTDSATAAAKKLSSDGLLPLKDSATGLKNLLSAGFSLPEATKLMEAFKDSAAFGRQGALSFGDAVRSATEGVKNGNSILVDNAGVTKNLSQILKEAGFSAQDLSRASSDVAVRQALLNGILKETAAQTGDAIKLTQTYAGQLTGMKTSWMNLLATWGDAITKNATVSESLGAVRDLFNRFNSVLSNNQRGYNLVSDAIIGFVKVLAGTVRAVNVVQSSFNSLDSIIAGATRGILGSLKSVADFLLKIVTVAAKVPGSGIALSVFGNEISQLALISAGAGSEIKTLGDRVAENDKRTRTWGATFDRTATSLDTLAGTLAETRGKTVQLGEATGALGDKLGDGPNGLAKKAGKAKTAIDALAVSVAALRDLRMGDLEHLSLPDIPPILPSGPTQRIGGISMSDFFHEAKPTAPPESFWRQLFPVRDIAAALGNAIATAFQGGGVGGAIKVAASGIGAAAGGVIGMAFGGPIGSAIGSALGSMAGPLIGQIGKLLGIGATEYEKRMRAAATETKNLQQQLINSHGSMAQLIIDADLVGINIKEAFSWKDPEAFKKIVGEIDDKTRLLNSAMQEYGFTWEDLGDKARNAKLSQLFDELFAKTDVLRMAGIDYHTILERQASDYSSLVQAAIRTGTEIPLAMKPVLQDLLDMGKLVDANGDAFGDLSQVQWSKTLTQGFDQVTNAIERMIEALDRVGQRHLPSFEASEDIPHFAKGGIVRRPTLALIGESGPEAVVPLTRGGMGLGTTELGGDTYVYIGNEAIDSHLVRVARGDAARGGLRPRAAHGRSY